MRKLIRLQPPRELSALLRRAFRGHEPRTFQAELTGPLLIRYSRVGDRAALERLAALDSRTLPEGWFLLAEIGDELVGAAPIDVDEEPVTDPFRPTAELRKLLELQVVYVRRHWRARSAQGAAPGALPNPAPAEPEVDARRDAGKPRAVEVGVARDR